MSSFSCCGGTRLLRLRISRYDLQWIISADRQNKGKTSMSALRYDFRMDSDLDSEWNNRTKKHRHR